MTHYRTAGIAVLLALTLAACSQETPKMAEAPAGPAADSTVTHIITAEQWATIHAEMQPLRTEELSSVVPAFGTIEAPPDHTMTLATVSGGYIQRIDVLPGQKVSKGQLVAVLADPELIAMQQQYLETKAQLAFASAEADRALRLSSDLSGSKKASEQAVSERDVLAARLSGIGERLSMMGIDVAALAKGTLQKNVTLRSPVTGFVLSITGNVGSYCKPTEAVATIVDAAHFHAVLTVYQRDAAAIREGQKVTLSIPGSSDSSIYGEVFLPGRSIKSDGGTEVQVELNRLYPQLRPGLAVSAVIETGRHPAEAIPEAALVVHDSQTYVIAVTAVNNASGARTVMPVRVRPGVRSGGLVEVSFMSTPPKNAVGFVTTGAPLIAAEIFGTGE